MIQGAIFDFDGTIADSMGIWENVFDEFMLSIGREPIEGIRAVIAPMTLPEAADYIIDTQHLPFSNAEICDRVNALVNHHYLNDTDPKAGVLDFLAMLDKNNVKMCIATVTKKTLVDEVLTKWGIRHYFADILAVTDFHCSKHEPTIYLEGLKLLSSTKENTLVFEDALYAAKTVKNHSFKLIGIYDNYEKKTNELETISDLYIRDFTELSLDKINVL